MILDYTIVFSQCSKPRFFAFQSKKTIDLMKKDFAEIRAAVGTDAVVALSRTVDTVKQKVTKSNIEGARDAIRTNVVRLFDDVSKKVAVVPPDDSETSSCIITEDGELKTLNALEVSTLVSRSVINFHVDIRPFFCRCESTKRRLM